MYYITVYYITVYYITVYYITVYYITVYYITVYYITVYSITVYYITVYCSLGKRRVVSFLKDKNHSQNSLYTELHNSVNTNTLPGFIQDFQFGGEML